MPEYILHGFSKNIVSLQRKALNTTSASASQIANQIWAHTSTKATLPSKRF